MKYHLRVYDNYHYADESEAFDYGGYCTYEEAENAAKAMVKEFLELNWSRGITPDKLIASFCMYGEDPNILPADTAGRHFSAREYASEIAGTICRKLEYKQKKMEIQTLYQDAIKFATYKHLAKRQHVKGTKLPYVVHLSNVAMEIFGAAPHSEKFDLIYSIQVALLHDTIEDTSTSFDEIKEAFGEEIAVAVLALSKNKELPEIQQIPDSLIRIKKLRREVWAVKLADRITNLQPAPADWTVKHRIKYLRESRIILDELKGGNLYLEDRLEAKINEYDNQIDYTLLPIKI
jgi:guanosine-3',5'-bis(diphosphate) 3'-pyrophosphohydrolase